MFAKEEFAQNMISLFNILNVTFGALMLVFIIGFFQKKNAIPACENPETEEETPSRTNADSQECREAEKEKFSELFNSIVAYFDRDKPYKSKDYNIVQLASKFETNIKYISQAINQNTGSNFNAFVNRYRIEAVVEMFNNGAQDKYSLDHIYSKVGFRHQSTFNTAFKKIMGMTPTEYIQSISLQ
jgi:AraC-like DNA-binding protein